MEPTLIAAQALASFTARIDEGRPVSVLDLCADDCAFVARGQKMGLEALRMAMLHRAAASYESRHVAGLPVIASATPDRITFSATVVSLRRGEGASPIAIADFTGTIFRTGNEWRFASIAMESFAE